MAKNKFKPTEIQKRCAEETGRSLAILAGAGSGKTAVLIERIKNIVTSGNANFSEIVAITFTEKAAGELIYRVTNEIPARFRSQVDLATITTIDGFCAKILREDAAAIGTNPDFDVLEEHSARILNHRIVSKVLKEMLKSGDKDAERVIDEMEYRHAMSCLEEMIEKRWSFYKRPKIEGQMSGKNRECLLYNSFLNCFGHILSKIAGEKKRLGVLDFTDLEIMTLELLKNHHDVKKKHRNRIKHLLIDEYQDTSDLQAEIVKEIFDPSANKICIVGDPSQSIYRFRGANPKGIYAMRKLIEESGGLTIELTENFRSSENILNFVNGIFSHSDNFLSLIARAKEVPGSGVVKTAVESAGLKIGEIRESEAAQLAVLISNLNNSGRASYGDIALLFRSFSDIRIYENALNKLNIPFYRSGGRTFLDQPEVTDIILCLRVLSNPENDTFAYGLARSSIIGKSDEECYRLFAKRTKSIYEILTENNDCSFLKNLMKLKESLSISELIREIADSSNLYEVYDNLTSSGQPVANIEKFISISEILSKNYDYTMEDLLEYIDDLKMRNIGVNEPPVFSTRDDAVKLLTVHAAKGLEFKIVILADLLRETQTYKLPYIIDKNGGMGFKLRETENPIADKVKTPLFEEILNADAEGEAQEKERLLYVAATRAKETLIVPTFNSDKLKSGWHKMLSPHADNLTEYKLLPTRHTEEKSAKAVFARHPSAPLAAKEMTLTTSQIESYHRCPRQFYLKYVLKIPSDKAELRTAKMGANTIGNVVHKVIQIASKNGIKNYHDVIRNVAFEYGYAGPEASDLITIERLLTEYDKSSYTDSKLIDSQHEIPFVFAQNGTTIKGTVDCIFRLGNSCAILDFKTDKINSDKDIATKTDEYRLQTLTYAIAAQKALKKEITLMTLLFLDAGHAKEIPLNQKDLKEGENLINKITGAIKNDRFGTQDFNTPCEGCPYHKNMTCDMDKLCRN